MGYATKIKCENCGYEDSILCTDDILEKKPGKISWGKTTLISKKNGYITHVKNNELYKYADKDRSDLTLDFKAEDIKCPRCNKKEFEVKGELEF